MMASRVDDPWLKQKNVRTEKSEEQMEAWLLQSRLRDRATIAKESAEEKKCVL